uniref:Putative secreted protein n=1 Tax=Rhipicephalus microplus TaxID=6941 RepID=A0A6M2DDL6_RHIMP
MALFGLLLFSLVWPRPMLLACAKKKKTSLIFYGCTSLNVDLPGIRKILILCYLAMWFNISSYRAALADLNVIPHASYFIR